MDKSVKYTISWYARTLIFGSMSTNTCPVIGRANEIESTVEILSRRTKNNPALIGEPGVGKTELAKALAWVMFAKKT